MKAAIIGIGWIGWKYAFKGEKHASHVSSYMACPKTELVAVADVDREKLEDFKIEHPEVEVYQDYEKMLSEVKPEIVSVCTPDETHYRIVRNTTRYHPVKVIFCEKPISVKVKEAESMVQTCEQFGVKLAINHSRRWDPAHRKIKEFLEQKEGEWNIGDPVAYAGRYSGGEIRDGVHMADLALWYGFKDRDLMNVATPYLVFEADLWGSEGLIRILGNGSNIQLWKPKPSQRYLRLQELEHVESLEDKYDFSKAMMKAVEDLVECARSDKQPECTGTDGRNAMWEVLGELDPDRYM